jgi:hypothetical protein
MAKEDDLLGFLATKGAIASGILVDGRQAVFDRAGGDARTVSVMTPVGVHAANGELWLVGEDGSGGPVIAQLAANGTPGSAQAWQSSAEAARDLSNGVLVVDDRAAPRRSLKWERASSGIGSSPFMSASTPHHYAQDTTLWLVAGSSYMTGGEERTQVALAPIGWSYP